MRNKRNACIAAVALFGMLQGFARADEATVGEQRSVSHSPSLFDGRPMLDDQALEARRGGTEVINDMKLNGVVSDNQAYNLSTGGNNISEGAFAGSSGMPMVIQNSGNNVLIQNATIVNVQVQ